MTIPNNIIVPGVYVDVTNDLAQSIIAPLTVRMLILGQMLNTGTATPNVPVKVLSEQQAVGLFGRGSMLAKMMTSIFLNNPFTEKWVLPLSDNGAGVAATGTATITGAATQTGDISLYIGGELVSCLVTAGDTQNTIATNLAAAINANGDLPVTASAATNVVTITARNKGTVGNTISLILNYRGLNAGEKLPAGVNVALVQMADGETNPVLTTALSNLPDKIFNCWVSPYSDSGIISTLENEIINRWNPLRQLDGFGIYSAGGSVSTVETAANINNQFFSCFDAGLNSPTPPYIWASAVSAQAAYSISSDPALPFNTLPLLGVLPSPAQDERTFLERQDLLSNGVATHKVTQAGQVLIDRLVTTYLTNGNGQPDISYRDANTLFTLSAFKQEYRAFMESNFSRCKLAADGARYTPDQKIATPKSIAGAAILFYQQAMDRGWVQDLDSFKTLSRFSIDQTDPTKVNSYLVVTLINGLQVQDVTIAFKLQAG